MDNIESIQDQNGNGNVHQTTEMSNNSKPVNVPKTRGRKKKVIEQPNNYGNDGNDEDINDKLNEKNLEILQIEQVKKKRGRKKKWEVETTTKLIDSCPILFLETKNENKNREIEENYEEHNVLFGNLNIKVHSNKEAVIVDDIKDNFKNENVSSLKCKIDLTNSDYEDFEEEFYDNNNSRFTKFNKNNKSNKLILDYTKSIRQSKIVEKNIKLMKYFVDEFDNGNEILVSPYRCYHCHNTFNNKPFFLPVEYNSELKRFKVTGNFCSPNCVKAYGLNSKTYCNKVYLVGFMYRILFGANYNIKPAPPIQCLKEYGGKLTIQEYRATFDNDKQYNLKDICSKVLMNEVISN